LRGEKKGRARENENERKWKERLCGLREKEKIK
jgi:hypothetical protein